MNTFLCLVPSARYIYLPQSPMGFPGGAVAKNPAANTGDSRDIGSMPELRRYPGVGNGNPENCLKNSMDRGAWQAAIHGVTES